MDALQCTAIDMNASPCDMFIPGNVYHYTLSGLNNDYVRVVDELGHNRIFSVDKLRFCVHNRSTVFFSDLGYAYFEFVTEQGE